MRSGRVIRIRVHMVDKPGELATVATAISAARANVLDVTHHRVFGSISAKHAELDLTVEVERPEDVKAIMASLKGCGFDAGSRDRMIPYGKARAHSTIRAYARCETTALERSLML